MVRAPASGAGTRNRVTRVSGSGSSCIHRSGISIRTRWHAGLRLDGGKRRRFLDYLRENDVEKARKFYRSLLLQNFDEASAGALNAVSASAYSRN